MIAVVGGLVVIAGFVVVTFIALTWAAQALTSCRAMALRYRVGQ